MKSSLEVINFLQQNFAISDPSAIEGLFVTPIVGLDIAGFKSNPVPNNDAATCRCFLALENKLLLVKEPEGYFNAIGGKKQVGEDDFQCLQRIVKAKIGLDLTASSLVKIGDLDLVSLNFISAFYFCESVENFDVQSVAEEMKPAAIALMDFATFRTRMENECQWLGKEDLMNYPKFATA